jgi:hypothetical protein
MATWMDREDGVTLGYKSRSKGHAVDREMGTQKKKLKACKYFEGECKRGKYNSRTGL